MKRLVILPGLDGTGRLFGPLKKQLPVGWNMTVISYPADRIMSTAALEKLARTQLPSQDPFVLVAESFGGVVALRIAAKPPPNMKALVLSASFACCPVSPVIKRMRFLLKESLFARRPPQAFMRYLIAGHACSMKYRALLEDVLLSVRPRVLIHRIQVAWDTDSRPALRQCPVPILYLQATRDRVIGHGALKSILKVRPDVQWRRISAPHFLLQLAPKEAFVEIRSFVDGLLAKGGWRRALIAAALCVIVIFGTFVHAETRLREGESLLFANGYAWLSPDGSQWTSDVDGWDYELKEYSLRRHVLAKGLGRALQLTKEDIATPVFRRRAAWFLADNVHRRQIQVNISGRLIPLQMTQSSGHARDQIIIPQTGDKVVTDGWMQIRTDLIRSDGEPIAIPILRVGPEGTIIVSDIDDTIKITNVNDRYEMLENTFVRPYSAVEGMASLYRHWLSINPNSAFFYLSASPWPIYAELSDFLNQSGFPRGILRLKDFSWRDQSFFSLWENPAQYKTPILEELFQRFPQRKFVLVGDTGEKDPEVYGAIARRFPNQIQDIYIHELADTPDARYQNAFQGLDPIHCHHFRNVRDLGLNL